MSAHSLTGSTRLRSTMKQCRSPRSTASAGPETVVQAHPHGRAVSCGETLLYWGEALQPVETQTTISILSSTRIRASRVHLSPLSYARQEYFDNPHAGAPPGTFNQASTSNTSTAMATNAIGNFEEYYFGRHGLCIEPDSEGSKIVRHADKRVGTFIRARRYKSSNVDEGSGGELRARDEERAQ